MSPGCRAWLVGVGENDRGFGGGLRAGSPRLPQGWLPRVAAVFIIEGCCTGEDSRRGTPESTRASRQSPARRHMQQPPNFPLILGIIPLHWCSDHLIKMHPNIYPLLLNFPPHVFDLCVCIWNLYFFSFSPEIFILAIIFNFHDLSLIFRFLKKEFVFTLSFPSSMNIVHPQTFSEE